MKIHDLPNQFDWSEYSEGPKKEMQEHIMADPYPCDDCCAVYNKDDLIDHFKSGHKICRNCIDEYDRIYK